MLDEIATFVLTTLAEEGPATRWHLADRLLEPQPLASAMKRRVLVDTAIEALAAERLLNFADSSATWVQATRAGSAVADRYVAPPVRADRSRQGLGRQPISPLVDYDESFSVFGLFSGSGSPHEVVAE